MNRIAGPQYGIYEMRMDENNRITVPSRFRPLLPTELAIGISVGKSGNWYLIAGSLEDCPGKIYEYPIELDSQGRLYISPALARRTGLSPENENTVLLMREKHLEIWSQKAETEEFLLSLGLNLAKQGSTSP